MHSFLPLLLATTLALAGCGSRERNGDNQEISPPPATPGEEIVFKLPRAVLAGDAGGPPLPTDRDELFTLARNKRAAGELDEALAFVDTLLVLQPNDPELIEFRGKALEQQGHPEDSLADFRRCCELEREACCQHLGAP